MICKKISYKDFRNIESAEIEFCDGVNIFYGNNAEGKTNALEGIYLFANGKSFRTSNDRDLIGFSKDISKPEISADTGFSSAPYRVIGFFIPVAIIFFKVISFNGLFFCHGSFPEKL